MKWLLIITSLVVNGVLGFMLLQQKPAPPNAVRAEFVPAGSHNSQPPLPRVEDFEPPVEKLPPLITTWEDAISTNLFLYKSNLVTIGCPPGIVSIVLESEVDQQCYSQLRALTDPLQNQFWDIFSRTNEIPHLEPFDDLKKKRGDLLHKLMISIPQDARRNLSPYEGIASESSMVKLEVIDHEYEERINTLNEKLKAVASMSKLDDQQKSEVKKLGEQVGALGVEKENQFKNALTPAERAEYELRNSEFARQMQNFPDFDASPEELRQLAQMSLDAKKSALIMSTLVLDSKSSNPNENFISQQTENEFKSALLAKFGKDRLEQFELVSNSDYQSLSQWSAAVHLPEGTARQLFDEKRLALAAADQIRASGLASDEKEAALLEIRDTLRSQLQTHMTPEAFATFRNENRSWINSLK